MDFDLNLSDNQLGPVLRFSQNNSCMVDLLVVNLPFIFLLIVQLRRSKLI